MDTEYSQKRHKSAGFGAPQRLVHSVIALWAETPGREISARMIADRADTSVSAIDYHFNGIERLYEETQAFALAAGKDWTQARLTQLMALAGTEMNLPIRAAIVAAIIDDWTRGSRPLAMACREACVGARSGRFVASHAGWTHLWQDFWADACRFLALAECADALALFFDGESSQHVLCWNRTLDKALLDETVTALLCFLEQGDMPPSPIRRAYCERAEAEYAELSDRPEIPAGPLDAAAVEILSTQGISALTFRAVASRAGATLGSTAYHFGSKQRMIRCAFSRLYCNSVDRPAMAAHAARGDLLDLTLESIVGRRQPILRAFDEIILHIGRDEEHTPLRAVIRGYRDPAATWVVEALLGKQGQVPPSLASAFSSICRGLDHLSIATGPDEARMVGARALAPFRQGSATGQAVR